MNKLAAGVRCPACACELMLVPAVTTPMKASGETLDAWLERWMLMRAKHIADPDGERRQYELWIQPRLGKRPLVAISRMDIEDWVEWIDGVVDAGDRIIGATALRIWAFLRAIFRDASASKIRALRVRSDNPAVGVRPPDGGDRLASTFLYPSEFLALVSSPEVTLERRRLYAIAIYLYPRIGELAALEWSDVDVTTGRIHMHRSLSRRGRSKRTKTGDDRQFVCERTLLPLLRAMHRQAHGRGRVFPDVPTRMWAAKALRNALDAADCLRADLHARDATRRPITFHDLRASGITWMAMRGDSGPEIMERVGHRSLLTTQRYIRRGRSLVAKHERVFPPLPRCLLAEKK